jgi:pyruvate formate-lyase activating enzyme-like uncharacterized protein
MKTQMPAALQAIQAEVMQFRQNALPLDDWKPDWEAFLLRARERVPGLVVDEGQSTVCLGELSPGCRACKDGAWDCIFLTHQCNLQCDFCYSPQNIPADYAGSAFGITPEMIAERYQHTHIWGIGFTGGEPFLQPQRLLTWVTQFRQRFPASYLWVYTNGLEISESALQRLGQRGLDEIRFNTAASGYAHPRVLENMRLAARHIGRITVEIPAIPEHIHQLLNSLAKWIDVGVSHLNLHELLYEPGTNSWSMAGTRQEFFLADGHHTAINPNSQEIVLKVFEYVQTHRLPLAVNYCSLANKLNQIRGRRLSLLPLTQAPHEKLLEGEILESYCLYAGPDDLLYCHPYQLMAMRQRYPDHQWVRLARMAPLDVQQKGPWVVFEPGADHAHG